MLQRHQAHHDEQRAAEHFSAALDPQGDRPPDPHDQPRADREQQGVSHRELDGDAQRPRAPRPSTLLRAGPSTSLRAGRGAVDARVHGQRGNGHQMIGAKTVQEAQEEGCDEKQQDLAIITRIEDRGSRVDDPRSSPLGHRATTTA
jgi:hypothetical protein